MTTHQHCPEEPSREMPGHVYMVPDKHWKFEAIGRDDHPGVCIDCDDTRRKARLCRGRDAKTLRPQYRASYAVISPDDRNGLEKDTAFGKVPTEFKLHKVLLYYPERHIGSLDQSDFHDFLRACTLINLVNRAIPNE
ncbi:MAG: hypothetical protein ABFS56_14320 [Pseudomonadota bacterium]